MLLQGTNDHIFFCFYFFLFLFCSIGEWGANEPSKLIGLVVKRKRAKDGRNRIKRENTTRKTKRGEEENNNTGWEKATGEASSTARPRRERKPLA